MEIDILAAAVDARKRQSEKDLGAQKGGSGKWVESVMQIERAPLPEHKLFRMQ